MNAASSRTPHDGTNTTTARRLSPQEAALRGASLAFQKQQHQGQGQGQGQGLERRRSLNNGGMSRQTTGSSGIARPDNSDAERERERERQALFLSGEQDHQGRLLSGKPSNASFIAATLAASRSVSPGSSGAEGGGGGRRGRTGSVLGPMGRPVVAVDDAATDATSLAPTNSLISMFESGSGGAGAGDRSSVRSGSTRSSPVRRPRKRVSVPTMRLAEGAEEEMIDRGDVESTPKRNKPKPKPKTKPKPKSQAQVRTREVITPPPVVRRVDTEIVSPRPRRPELPPRLEPSTSSNESFGISDEGARMKRKPPPKSPKPKTVVHRAASESQLAAARPDKGENRGVLQGPPLPPARNSTLFSKARPSPPKKSIDLSERLPLELKGHDSQTQAPIGRTDGQEEYRLARGEEDTAGARPSTSESKSSDDSFVSAPSEPARDDADSLLTVEPPTPSASTTPRRRPSRSKSTQPTAPSLPLRRSWTGSSAQLPLGSLSNAIVAGSLASARHTPTSFNNDSNNRSKMTPPPPPSRRMKHTLRQPTSKSDDEDERRPHHHHKKVGLHSKKHAHHEGSRSRWREEITEREKRRYEAIWASNRGLFLVPDADSSSSSPSQDAGANDGRHPKKPKPTAVVRDQSYEALSQYVANVVVRDIWSRSRLPDAELAEVWDLVYSNASGGGGGVRAALGKHEFVVGMWLIDQRLRGRKIPPRVSESVWDSAKGVRVLAPAGHHHHPHLHHHHKGKGKG